MIFNSTKKFGVVSVLLHWLVAITVIGLFALGLWMTELDYYHSWYQLAPWWHKSIGILLFAIVIFRLCWRFINSHPSPLATHKSWETTTSKWVHLLLYLLMLVTMISGYLISTADNRPIEIFGWFAIPATITSLPNQEDIAGWIHLIVASILIGFVVLHVLAALKHHFIDKDRTLLRILGK